MSCISNVFVEFLLRWHSHEFKMVDDGLRCKNFISQECFAQGARQLKSDVTDMRSTLFSPVPTLENLVITWPYTDRPTERATVPAPQGNQCLLSHCLFPLDVQNEIELLSRVFCYSWLVCLLGFWLRSASLEKNSVIRFGMASFSFFTLLNA